MHEELDKRKVIGTVVGIVVFICCVLFFTYARYEWRSGTNTNVAIEISDATVICNFSADVSFENIGPVLNYQDGVKSGTLTIENYTNTLATDSLILNISSISDSLLVESFKYKVVQDVNGGTDFDYDNPLDSGNFSSFQIGENVLTDKISVAANSIYSYQVIVYIDGTMPNDENMMESSMNASLKIGACDGNGNVASKDILVTSITIDGEVSESLPTSGTYSMSSTCNLGSTLTWNTYNKSITYGVGSKIGDKCSVNFTSSTDYPKLSEMEVGSYVAYTGSGGTVGDTSVACQTNGSASSSTASAETEAPNSCSGQNAREDLDTSNYTYGYCYDASYKYYTTGWRIAYIDNTDADNPKAVLISAGSPECNTRSSIAGNTTYIKTANSLAMKYCNSNYVDGNCTCEDTDADGYCDCTDSDENGLCDEIENKEVDAWAVNDIDFYYMTKAISGYGKRLASSSSSLGDSGGTLGTTLYCYSKYSYQECGYHNDLLDNGGYYWFAARYSSSDASGVGWRPFYRYVFSTSNTYAYGLRPVIRLSSSVYVTGGSGTMDDPYTILN